MSLYSLSSLLAVISNLLIGIFIFIKRRNDLPLRKWTQRRENGRIAIISKEVSDGAEEDKAV